MINDLMSHFSLSADPIRLPFSEYLPPALMAAHHN